MQHFVMIRTVLNADVRQRPRRSAYRDGWPPYHPEASPAWLAPNTRVIDLGAGCAMPGFAEVRHGHLPRYWRRSCCLTGWDIRPVTMRDADVVAAIRWRGCTARARPARPVGCEPVRSWRADV